MKKSYDMVCVGNYTKDTIITPGGTRTVDGGAVNYAAHAAVRLGLKTGVVTRLAREDNRMIEALQQAGVDCYPEYTPTSTLMTLEYKTSNVDQRTLTVTATAGTVTPRQMDGLEAKAVVVGSSLRGEVELAFFQAMRERPGAKLALDLPVDDQILTAEPGSPLAAPISIGGFHDRQSLVHPSDGGLGRQSRRLAVAAYAAPLAELRPQRRQADLGRRGGRRAARRASQSPIKLWPRRQSRGPGRAARASCTRAHRQHFGTADDLLVGLQLTHSGRFCRPNVEAAGAANRLPPSAARRQVRHRSGR